MWQRFHQFCHWGPITALSIIVMVTIVTHFVFLTTNPVSPFVQRLPSQVVDSYTWSDRVTAYIGYGLCTFWQVMILVSYFRAAFLTPGYVPLKWQPSDPDHQKYLQFCEVCQGFKPPRAHHCRKCHRCVLKMDHHCPWINICAGQRNQASFISFLFSCTMGAVHCLVYLAPFVFHVIYAEWYRVNEPEIYRQLTFFSFWQIFSVFMATGFSVGVFGTVGFLFVAQLRQVLANRTFIEQFIVVKADKTNPNFIFPYDLGSWRRNLIEVFGRSSYDATDYLSWPLRQGSSSFDLTLEQIRQEHAKKQEELLFYEITTDYNGNWLPIFRFTLRSLVLPPLPCEDFLAVRPGDVVAVAIITDTWLYGEIVSASPPPKPENPRRGWFPQASARLFQQNNDKKC